LPRVLFSKLCKWIAEARVPKPAYLLSKTCGNSANNFNFFLIMRVKLIQRPNPLDRTQNQKYYAHMENEGVIELSDLATQITKYSSLSYGDVLNVLENMVDAASLFLQMGRGVKLGSLGMLRIILKSKGADTPEEFNCNLIKRVKLLFHQVHNLKDNWMTFPTK